MNVHTDPVALVVDRLIDRLLEADRAVQACRTPCHHGGPSADAGGDLPSEGTVAELEALRAKLARLQPEMDRLYREVEMQEPFLQEAADQASHWKRQHDDCSAEVTSLRGEVANFQTHCAELLKERLGLIEERDALAVSLAARQEELDQLKVELAEATKAQEALVWQAKTTAMRLKKPEYSPPDPMPPAAFSKPFDLSRVDAVASDDVVVWQGLEVRLSEVSMAPPDPMLLPADTVDDPDEDALDGLDLEDQLDVALDRASRPPSHPNRGGIRAVIWDDPAYDDVLKRMWEAGERVPAILVALNAMLPAGRAPFRELQIQGRAGSQKYRRPVGFQRNLRPGREPVMKVGAEPTVKTPPSGFAGVPPVQAPGGYKDGKAVASATIEGIPQPVQWTDAMDAALIEYANTGAAEHILGKIMSFEFGVAVGQVQAGDRARKLLAEGKAGWGGKPPPGATDAAYRIAGQRFWSRSDISRAEALRHLEHNGFYYRFQPDDLTDTPALFLLQDGRVSLEHMTQLARAHFGVEVAS